MKRIMKLLIKAERVGSTIDIHKYMMLNLQFVYSFTYFIKRLRLLIIIFI